MNIRKVALSAALASALSVPTLANAIQIAGIDFAAGAIFETIELFEAEDTRGFVAGAPGNLPGNGNGIIDEVGEKLVGIGEVFRIRQNDPANGNPVLWQTGNNGQELTIYFYDYVTENIALLPNSSNVKIGFTGGVVEIWAGPDLGALSFAPTATQAGGIATATDGVLWLKLAGSPIGIEGIPSGEFGSVSNDPITLRSVGPLFDPAVTIGGVGNLDVIGGLAAGYFDTNTFNCIPGLGNSPCPNDADKVFTSSGQLGSNLDPTANNFAGWAFFGTGEVQDFAVVPEPGTLALLGLGLAGLSFGARRQVKKS
jgi:hypothetical protein